MVPPFALALMRAFVALAVFAMAADLAVAVLRSPADLAFFLVCLTLTAAVHGAAIIGFARLQRSADGARRPRR